jgi:hypothetical protein
VSKLNGRVRVLERRGRLAAGCSTCGGRMLHLLEPGEDPPPWLDAASCCRRCGTGAKLIDRDGWGLL